MCVNERNMTRIWVTAALVAVTTAVLPAAKAPQLADVRRLTVEPVDVRLADSRSRQQLVVTAHAAHGYLLDATRQATFASTDPAIAAVDRAGVVRPVRAGTTRIHITVSGQTVEAPVTVGDLMKTPRVSFNNEVMSILGKAGCNSGPCHGHNSGKGGFKLSLRGYDAAADFQRVVGAEHGRIDRDDLEQSKLLLKPTGQMAHRGGKRFGMDSAFYKTLRQWLVEKAESDVGRAVKLSRIEVLPEHVVFPQTELQQQLIVRAHFADGSVRDVTDQAIYELSAEGVVEVSPEGVVTARREGEAAVFVRFLGHMGLSRFVVIQHKPNFAWTEPPANNFIDQHVWAKLKSIQVLPSDLSSDVEFLRRASLDTVGLPPTAADARAFLADSRPDKRQRKIDELFDDEGFGDVWASYWLEISGTYDGGASIRPKGMRALSFWLRHSINRNLPYDHFVRALVASKGGAMETPAIFFGVNRLAKVEVIPQLFLGIRLECAQCHDHPFDIWKQADYQALGHFFIGLASKEGPGEAANDVFNFVPPENFLPWEKDKKRTLRLLDGSTVSVPATRDPRDYLVDWLFGPAKKRTARALVNRVWGKLFGRGIVEAVDDMRFSNPPVNEPLLDALADDFIAHKYDFKRLVRTILNSRAYQLSSVANATNVREQMNFSHARLRRRSAEQLYDAIALVTGVHGDPLSQAPPGLRAAQFPGIYTGSNFLAMFGRPTQRMSPCECIRSHETTLPQILHLLNGDTVSKKLRAEGGVLNRLLAGKLGSDRLVEELYFHVLSRPPDQRERRLALEYMQSSEDHAQGAEDLMWALLTSQEFLFNH